ncbi:MULTISPECIES: 2-oxo-4-hydroxy-4-carboxy-5-ureidoimidazoline decarboxylase [Neobacillus]|uniref:2-oxo-4-hydroxy-4-carboxy-5-ureidoimidazoline decarboxylase n=1 Tax=Neobacillus citreus TaxID=2833578 RepID=A0A942SUL8_9BACI|nr:2-oxo-4-hydroxy-4-carboxy-5-ureidoimidazoline decarboxylase [Neobacillus citreus]MCH6266849.1 2-oxo-4-hydroxy-4-carboxy-5-ureidoimidazoline decarboxylase [Neobacillus citreus]
MTMKLETLNSLDQPAFTEVLGWVFEHSPWVAERTWVNRPFQSVADLHQALVDTVKESTMEEKLALLRAHPDLAARVQMADASVKEQASAGLNQLTKEEHEEFLSLNNAYTSKFQFPFIMAVKGQTKETIRGNMKERVNNDPPEELQEALTQIFKIAFFRLEDFIIK